MEKIAIISDIHGNLPALEAVLDDIRRRGIRRIFCLGDLVGKGPEPARTVDRIRDVCERTVQGNWDHGISEPQEKEAGRWQQERISGDRLAYLRALPFCIDLTLSGRRIRLFHASAESVYTRVLQKADKKTKLRLFENTVQTGAFSGGEAPDIVGYGDIHVPFVQTVKSKQSPGRMLFNTGSVGAPYDGIPQSSYSILEGVADGGPESPFSLSTVRVPYDTELAIAIAEREGLPQLERFRYEIKTGHEQNK